MTVDAAIDVPLKYPTSLVFVDESTAKQSAGTFFVVGAVKLRRPGLLLRGIRDIRDRHGYDSEFKFSRISRGKLPVFCELIDLLEQSDAHIAACVVDRKAADPFKPGEDVWVTHARITAKLLVGITNRRELTSAILDQTTTPKDCAFDDTVREMVNGRIKATSLVTATCIDSKSNDGVQLADLVAGAVAHQRGQAATGNRNPNSHKAKIAARLATAFGVAGFDQDVRTERVNVITHGNRSPKPSHLRSVGKSSLRAS
jgi:hypothetical protein